MCVMYRDAYHAYHLSYRPALVVYYIMFMVYIKLLFLVHTKFLHLLEDFYWKNVIFFCCRRCKHFRTCDLANTLIVYNVSLMLEYFYDLCLRCYFSLFVKQTRTSSCHIPSRHHWPSRCVSTKEFDFRRLLSLHPSIMATKGVWNSCVL